MRYFHDTNGKTVFAMSGPSVTEETDRRTGRRTGWHVSAEIEITRADNVLLKPHNRWRFSTLQCPDQHLDAHYERVDVERYFDLHHKPRFRQVDQDEYERLRAEYDKEARRNCE